MKRFVDLRNTDVDFRFAWYDTIKDIFENYEGWMAWDTFDEFADLYDGEEIDRYRKLCPDWAFNEEPKMKRLKQISPPTLIDEIECPNCGEFNLNRLDKRLLEIKRTTAWRGGLVNLDNFPDISCRNCGAGFEEEEDEAK